MAIDDNENMARIDHMIEIAKKATGTPTVLSQRTAEQIAEVLAEKIIKEKWARHQIDQLEKALHESRVETSNARKIYGMVSDEQDRILDFIIHLAETHPSTRYSVGHYLRNNYPLAFDKLKKTINLQGD